MSRLTINSNISSLNAQRNFTTATKKLSESYTRLSSGLRINKAADDAAGLSISESLKADTRLFNQGVRNLNDGASILSIADGALSELSNITVRLRELATQSSNGTLGTKQRQALDQEAQSLAKEFNRIARTTEFNGRKLFNGDFGELSLAAGGGQNTLIRSGLGGGVGDGTYTSQTSYSSSGADTYGISYGDLNGDGLLDLITGENSDNSVGIFIGNGDGTFKSRTSFASGSTISQVLIVDLDGDGKRDLVTSSAGGILGMGVLIGNGDGSFKARVSYETGALPSALDLGDFNQDGKLDLVTADYGGISLSVLLSNGNGTFKSRISVNMFADGYSVKVADINGDQIEDLVGTDSGSDKIVTFIGNGNGTFKSRTSYAVGSFPTDIAVGDFNNDGISDVSNIDETDGTVSVFFGSTSGTLSSRVSYSAGIFPSALQKTDINGDGIIDLAVQSGVGEISILYGNSNGSFQARISRQIQNGSQYFSLVDLDNDGVLDIASANRTSGVGIVFGNSNDGVAALQSFSLKTQTQSRDAMDYLESALTLITKQRGQIGAFQSRVETATNNLQQSSLAYSEATSRITDADIAEESSKLVANQIVQQAAASVLAQANQQPQLALQLLGNI